MTSSGRQGPLGMKGFYNISWPLKQFWH
jgi:hypothetical protein